MKVIFCVEFEQNSFLKFDWLFSEHFWLKGAMAFMVKHMIGGQLKDLTGGIAEEKPEGEKSEAAAKGMTQEEFEQYQQQLAEEK